MSSDISAIGTSALLAYQRALATTSHNISNANTDGYSRQRTALVTAPPQLYGSSYKGTGVQVLATTRVYDRFLNNQVNTATSALNRLQTYNSMASRIDSLLSDSRTGLSTVMQGFFNSIQDVANDPGSLSARRVMLGQAELLSTRFNDIDAQLDAIGNQINDEIVSVTADISRLAKSIAELNNRISIAVSSGISANDLLDRRDQMIREMAGLVSISTVEQEDGSVNVFIGNGQPVVTGGVAGKLTAIRNDFNQAVTEVGLFAGETAVNITGIIAGGKLGGLLSFRLEVLDQARNGLGLIARGLAADMNLLHGQGMDLLGQQGEDLFVENTAQVLVNVHNTGSAGIIAEIIDSDMLSASDYHFRYEGVSGWTVTRLTDNTVWTATMPSVVDGINLTVSGTPVIGDRFLLQPTRTAAAGIGVAFSDPHKLAMAAPIIAAADSSNISDASISPGMVVNAGDPQLLNTTRLVFADPGHYQIEGVGALIAYTSGDVIEINGWRVKINGLPAAGDAYTVAANTAPVNDNRNALSLARLQSEPGLGGGRLTFQSAWSALLGETGEKARGAGSNLTAMQSILEQAVAARDSVSAVNLDEEAANLIRYQQSYQAAARVITMANDLFNTLLLAIRR
jgi:flagellar hook-associated protein 1 FlgK